MDTSEASNGELEMESRAGSPIRAESPPMLQTPRHLKAGYWEAQRHRYADMSDEWNRSGDTSTKKAMPSAMGAV